MMPSKAVRFRARQVATLATIYHQCLVDAEYGALLEDLGQETLDPWIGASVREAKRERDKAVRVPATLVHEIARTASLAYEAWVQARQESDFETFAPWLRKMTDLKRQEAACLTDDARLPYDALIDIYEPGMTTAQLDPLFEELRPRLAGLLERIMASPRQPKSEVIRGTFPTDQQETFGRMVITAMGFDWEAGRLDRSPHPFCSGLTPFDVRITTRYSEEDFSIAFFGMVHEAGHGLYEQGLDPDRFGLHACEAISLGIHESQSRLWEIFVARSGAFWDHWFEKLRQQFPGQFNTTLHDFLHAVNQVKAGPIRVDADEVTYGLHVILRYEIEKALMEETLEVEDLEQVWNSKMASYLQVTPAHASEGVLQDVHWSHGLIGYFPTYLLGTLYAAQLFRKALDEIGSLQEEIASGHLLSLREWLRQKVHQPGRTRTAEQLIREVTGANLNSEHFLDHLEDKYGRLYAL
jgi:carboxypeptidase Taq